MKHLILFFLLYGYCQMILSQPCGITYFHDAAGNRFKRFECSGPPSLKKDKGQITELMPENLSNKNGLKFEDEVNENLSLSEMDDDILVYPNPSSNFLFIKIKETDDIPEVYFINMFGVVLKMNLLSENKVDIENLPSGNYLVVIKAPKAIKRFKITKFF